MWIVWLLWQSLLIILKLFHIFLYDDSVHFLCFWSYWSQLFATPLDKIIERLSRITAFCHARCMNHIGLFLCFVRWWISSCWSWLSLFFMYRSRFRWKQKEYLKCFHIFYMIMMWLLAGWLFLWKQKQSCLIITFHHVCCMEITIA